MNNKIFKMLGTIVLSICTINVFAQGQITMYNPSPTIVGSNVYQDVSGGSTAGYIGVNTTSPVNQLDVNGSFQTTYVAPSSGGTYYIGNNSSLLSGILGISGLNSAGAVHVPTTGTAFSISGIVDFTAGGGSLNSVTGYYDLANSVFNSFEASANEAFAQYSDGSGVDKSMQLSSTEAKIACTDNNNSVETNSHFNATDAEIGYYASGNISNNVDLKANGIHIGCYDGGTNNIANVITVNQDNINGLNFSASDATYGTANFSITSQYGMSVNCDGYVNGNWAWSSDARYKKDVTPIENALDKILKLKGVYYDFKTDEFKDHHFPSNKQVGFIAQDVQKVFPEVVMTGKDGYLAIQYHKVVPLLVEGIKDQQNQFEEAMKQKDDQIEQLLARVDKLEKTVNELSKTDNSQSVGINSTDMPTANELLQNKPNPFNNTTTIQYTIADNATNAYIQIEDINNKIIKHIDIKPGKGSVELSFSDLPAQVMLYSLYVNNGLVTTKKMIKQ